MPNNKTCLIAIALLSLTLLGLIYLWQPDSISSAEIRLESIPLKAGEWKGEDISISERIYQLLETKDVLTRKYINSRGRKVVLAIVYSGVNRGAFHPPEICYLGGGRELLNKSVEKIEITEPGKNPYTIKVNRLLMGENGNKEIAWYWFTAGNRATANYYRQQCYFIWDGLMHNHAGGALEKEQENRGDKRYLFYTVLEGITLILNNLDTFSKKKNVDKGEVKKRELKVFISRLSICIITSFPETICR